MYSFVQQQVKSSLHVWALLLFSGMMLCAYVHPAFLLAGAVLFFLVTSMKLLWRMLIIMAVIGIAVAILPFLAPLVIILMIIFFILRIRFVIKNWRPLLAGLFVYGVIVPVGYRSELLRMEGAGLLNQPTLWAEAGIVALLAVVVLHLVLKGLYWRGYSASMALGMMGSVPLVILSFVLPFLKLHIPFAEPVIEGGHVVHHGAAVDPVHNVSGAAAAKIGQPFGSSEAPVVQSASMAGAASVHGSSTAGHGIHHTVDADSVHDAAGSGMDMAGGTAPSAHTAHSPGMTDTVTIRDNMGMTEATIHHNEMTGTSTITNSMGMTEGTIHHNEGANTTTIRDNMGMTEAVIHHNEMTGTSTITNSMGMTEGTIHPNDGANTTTIRDNIGMQQATVHHNDMTATTAAAPMDITDTSSLDSSMKDSMKLPGSEIQPSVEQPQVLKEPGQLAGQTEQYGTANPAPTSIPATTASADPAPPPDPAFDSQDAALAATALAAQAMVFYIRKDENGQLTVVNESDEAIGRLKPGEKGLLQVWNAEGGLVGFIKKQSTGEVLLISADGSMIGRMK